MIHVVSYVEITLPDIDVYETNSRATLVHAIVESFFSIITNYEPEVTSKKQICLPNI